MVRVPSATGDGHSGGRISRVGPAPARGAPEVCDQADIPAGCVHVGIAWIPHTLSTCDRSRIGSFDVVGASRPEPSFRQRAGCRYELGVAVCRPGLLGCRGSGSSGMAVLRPFPVKALGVGCSAACCSIRSHLPTTRRRVLGVRVLRAGDVFDRAEGRPNDTSCNVGVPGCARGLAAGSYRTVIERAWIADGDHGGRHRGGVYWFDVVTSARECHTHGSPGLRAHRGRDFRSPHNSSILYFARNRDVTKRWCDQTWLCLRRSTTFRHCMRN